MKFSFFLNMVSRAVFVVVLTVSLVAQAMAEDRPLSGIVSDASDGEPLVGASVRVSGTSIGTVTDERGEYRLSIPADAREMTFSYTGYATKTVSSGSGSVLNVTLREGSVETGEIVVYSTRSREKLKNIPRKTEIITEKDIEAVAPVDATELLKKSAGVDVIEYPGLLSGVSIRGFTPNYGSYFSAQYVTYLLDGRPLGTRNLSTVDMNLVERVEVIKGPSSALYGSQGMGGTVNFITKKSSGPISGSASAGYSSFATYDANVAVGGSIGERFDFDLGARYFSQDDDYRIGSNTLISDPHPELLDPELLEDGVETMRNSTYSTNSATLRFGYRINENFRLDLRGSVFNAPSVRTAGTVWGYYDDGLKDVFRRTADISLTGTSGAHSITLVPYWAQDKYRYLDDTAGRVYASSTSEYTEYGFQLQDAIRFGTHRFTAGVDYRNASLEGRRYSAPDVSIRPYSPDSEQGSLGVFGEFGFSFLDEKLIANLGGRYDMTTFRLHETPLIDDVDTEEEEDSDFSPSASIQYRFLPDLKVHASIGRAFVSPTALQKSGEYTSSWGTVVRGNPDLDPETSTTWDAGLTWSNDKGGWRADVTYFHTDWDDFITTEYLPDGTQTYVNAANAKMRGLEFELSYDFGAFEDYRYSLRCFANYTHQLEAKVTTDGVEEDMKWNRKGVGSFGIEYDDFRRFSARLSARYIGSRYETNYFTSIRDDLTDPVLDIDPSLVVDATLGIDLDDNNTVTVSAKNIFDELYTEKDGYPMPGRSYGVRYTVRF
ncbi:TonB-dependent receptor [Prosthecochloris sp. GSB1]|uniref:TonB-dependent receptor n=1 Tax=Prosthecochloris sp. GSB1 TaxID=281093 RepID=UPI000B8CF7AE|nr:TonB-dependent receptor [Prosthecochloris sp. GSB1]ASQ90374.1 TonB-dependent receptor [Prosthecochloris sp. GSB1]